MPIDVASGTTSGLAGGGASVWQATSSRSGSYCVVSSTPPACSPRSQPPHWTPRSVTQGFGGRDGGGGGGGGGVGLGILASSSSSIRCVSAST
eukprot:scaffold68793_cov30-Tisochrysis_lutea.AAC.1